MVKTTNKNNGFCYHDYANSLPVEKVDHRCQKCLQILDPFEWFLMTNFNIVDVTSGETRKELQIQDAITSKNARVNFSLKSKLKL